MDSTVSKGPAIAAGLADRISDAGRDLVQAWSSAVRADPLIPTQEDLDTPELTGHLPAVLDEVRRRLSGEPSGMGAGSFSESGSVHGRDRWWQGYALVELMREAEHLRRVLLELVSRALDETGVSRLEKLDLWRVVAVAVDEHQSAAVEGYAAAREVEALDGERVRAGELESVVEVEDQFLATLSHGLRTALTPILGWVRLLRTEPMDEGVLARGLEAIEGNALVQTRLIDEVLDASRVVSGPLEMAPIDVTGVVREAHEAILPRAEAEGVRLRLEEHEQALVILGDASRLRQVVWNLLSNAIGFSRPEGEVLTEVREADGAARILVRDQGVGIRPALLARLFDPKPVAAGGTEPGAGAPGLGLAVVRSLVERHGGTVAAESGGEGLGATFTVDLPLRPPAAGGRRRSGSGTSRKRAAPSGAAEALEGVRVLVVDDEQDARDLLTFVLETRRAIVAAASSAGEALALLDRESPDVLVSDIGMPDGDGYHLIRQLRALEAQRGAEPIPALALTAYAREEDHREAIAAGFQMHIPKPVAPDELTAAVAILSAKRKRR